MKIHLFIFAYIISITAFAIDLILPAYSAMEADLSHGGLGVHYVVLIFIAGAMLGELLSGFFADCYGRKNILLISAIIFGAASGLCYFSNSFEVLLLGRFIQGFSAASQKIALRAMIRDLYEGNRRAQVMSFILSLLITIPFIAPLVGQMITEYYHWRSLFTLLAAIAVGAIMLISTLPETLKTEHKARLTWQQIKSGSRGFITNTQAMGYTLTAGLMFGMQLTFLSQAPLYFADSFNITDHFPYYYAAISCCFGFAFIINGWLLQRYPMARLAEVAIWTLVFIGALDAALFFSQEMTLAVFFIFMIANLTATGILFGNITTLVTEPCAAIAGLGSSLSAAISSGIALMVSAIIGANYHGTLAPFVLGLLVCSILGLVCFYRAKRAEFVAICYASAASE